MAAVALKRAYLAAYNWAVFFGWAQVLYYAATTLLSMGHEGVYAAVERPLQLAQTAAVLEILHGLVGLVRSPVSAMLPQIGSGLFVTWGILWSFPETRTHMLVSSLVISWSITEVFRVAVLQAAAVRGDQGRARQHQNRGPVPRHPRPSSPPRLLSLPPCGSTPRPSSEGVGVDSSASSNANHSFCKPPKSSPNFRQWTTCYLHSSYKVGQSETNGANLKTREAPFSKSISYYTCRSSIM